MTGGFEVDLDTVRQHVADTRSLMDYVEDAALESAPLDVQAFGIIGSTWSLALTRWTAEASTFITTAAQCGNRMADELESMAADYETKDVENRDLHHAVLEEFDDNGPRMESGR